MCVYILLFSMSTRRAECRVKVDAPRSHHQRSGRLVGRRRSGRVGRQHDFRFVLGSDAVVHLQVRLDDDFVEARVQHCRKRYKKKINKYKHNRYQK